MNKLFGARATTLEESFPVAHTEEEWRERLTPEQFRVLRGHGTERAGTSPLNAEHRLGTFLCAGCGQPLFGTDEKFESGTGWPSFIEPCRTRSRPPRIAACG